MVRNDIPFTDTGSSLVVLAFKSAAVTTPHLSAMTSQHVRQQATENMQLTKKLHHALRLLRYAAAAQKAMSVVLHFPHGMSVESIGQRVGTIDPHNTKPRSASSDHVCHHVPTLLMRNHLTKAQVMQQSSATMRQLITTGIMNASQCKESALKVSRNTAVELH